MTSTTTTPYPPFRPHHTTRLSPSAALSNITAYLLATETQAHLHPDAQLTPEEIKFSTTGGPSGGITLHHLRRVEKGLAGETIAPPTAEELGEMLGLEGEGEEGGYGGGPRKSALKKRGGEEEVEGWMDKEEWERSRDVVEGEVGERDAAAGVEVEAEAMEVDGGEGLSQREKEARKADKKERRKAERRQKEEAKNKS